jgi:hypothetical protein
LHKRYTSGWERLDVPASRREALFANAFSYGATEAAEELSLQVTVAAGACDGSGGTVQGGLLLRVVLGGREWMFRLHWSDEGAKLEREIV